MIPPLLSAMHALLQSALEANPRTATTDKVFSDLQSESSSKPWETGRLERMGTLLWWILKVRSWKACCEFLLLPSEGLLDHFADSLLPDLFPFPSDPLSAFNTAPTSPPHSPASNTSSDASAFILLGDPLRAPCAPLARRARPFRSGCRWRARDAGEGVGGGACGSQGWSREGNRSRGNPRRQVDGQVRTSPSPVDETNGQN